MLSKDANQSPKRRLHATTGSVLLATVPGFTLEQIDLRLEGLPSLPHQIVLTNEDYTPEWPREDHSSRQFLPENLDYVLGRVLSGNHPADMVIITRLNGEHRLVINTIPMQPHGFDLPAWIHLYRIINTWRHAAASLQMVDLTKLTRRLKGMGQEDADALLYDHIRDAFNDALHTKPESRPRRPDEVEHFEPPDTPE